MILLVEDNASQLEYLLDSIKRINSDLEMVSATSISEARHLVEKYETSAFFLDIQLSDGSGIKFAKELRKIRQYHLTPIVFITGLATKELDAFRSTHCYDYIVKPFSHKRIAEVVGNLFNNQTTEDSDESYVLLDFKGVGQRVDLKDIIYIESRRRKIFIVTRHEIIEYKVMRLTNFFEALDGRFEQVHQSFIINKDYVERVDIPNSTIKMYDASEKVPIGKSYKRKVKDIDDFFRNTYIIKS